MLPWDVELAGRLDRHTFDSTLLRGNPLGDPHERPLWVYTPPGYDDSDERYPAVYVIQGYTGFVSLWENRQPYRQPYVETADTVFADGAPGCVVVYVDAWTKYGGSQFVDSPGTGQYHSYLCDEIVPWVDEHYRTIQGPGSRAVQGKSSGGFGAMITPMLRPDLFGALATHAGDSLHEYCYLPEFANVVRALRGYDHDIMRWWDEFSGRVAFTKDHDQSLLMILGVAACYSAADDGTPVLPFDEVTGALRPDVWQKWLDWDPVRMVPGHTTEVQGLRAVWIDAGTRDQWYLDLGADAYRKAVLAAGLPEDRMHFEHFDGTHTAIDYRYPLALKWLAEHMDR